MIDQPQPNERELEAAVIGAMLLEKDSLYKVLRILTYKCFYVEAHALIFKTMSDMFKNSEHIDLLTVSQKLRAKGVLEKIGGAYFVTDLTTRVNSSAHIETHAALVKEAWIKRSIIDTANRTLQQAYKLDVDALDTLDKVIGDFNKLVSEIHQGGIADLKEVGYAIIEKSGHNLTEHKLLGVPSGMIALDSFTSGWKAPDLIVIAARPSMGKTAFVLQCALNAVTRFRKKVAVFSLEMSVEQCLQRLFSSISQIELSKIIKGQVTAQEQTALEAKGSEIIDSGLVIDDAGGHLLLGQSKGHGKYSASRCFSTANYQS